MSREKPLNLKLLRDSLKRCGVTKRFLSVILRRPSGYIEERLSGKKPFTYSELLSIVDLIGYEISDVML